MSRETLEHLNTNTLIGFTAKRGQAWHYRAEQQGDEPNHYPGPVPVIDVQRRLFHWQAESRRVAVEAPASVDTMTHLTEDGEPAQWLPIPDRQAIARSDQPGQVMGLFGAGYLRHKYSDWLLTTVADLLDEDLAVSSAGLLRGGAVAWVEVSVPDNITTPEGVEFRPNLLATTSFDGSIATTFKRTITDVVCDNTRELALAEPGQQVKIKHSRQSETKLAPAREALGIVHSLGDEFAAEVASLCAIEVTEDQWQNFLDKHIPVAEDTLTGRGRTMADAKRQQLIELYTEDPRVAPWTGTAHGVLQAVNTYEHHLGTVRGASRSDRNMLSR